MREFRLKWKRGALASAIALALPMHAAADATTDALKIQVEALQKQLQQVQETLQRYEEKSATKQEVQELKQDVAEVSSQATEWKTADSVVHLAGYGDVTYTDNEDDPAAFTGARVNPIFHFQYKNLVMMESELEIEVEDDGGTSVSLEYVTIDYFLNDYVALIGGKFLSAVGQFRQNGHPSWINKLPTAPSGFGHDQAAPNSDVGLQARGGFPLWSDSTFANYALYVSNGPVLEINGDEIEEINSGGRTSNNDDRFVFGGRVGFLPIPMLEFGLSGATGKIAGDDEPKARRDYTVYGADLNYKWNNLRLLGEYVKQKVGSESSSAAPDSANWEAWYAQASYRFYPTGFEGVVRYSDYDSPHRSEDQKQWALGINYVLTPSAMIKAAYNFNDGKDGSKADDDGFQIQAAYGF